MSKSEKKPKDANAPKRPQSAFFLFSNFRRSEFKKQGSDKKITEISKVIAAEWKQMDESAKKKWQDEAKIIKTKYDEDVEKYKKTPDYKKHLSNVKKWKEKSKNEDAADSNDENDDEDNSKKKKTKMPKKPKDANAPKRPPSGYFLFQNERRNQIRKEDPAKKMKEIVQMIGSEWQAMTENDKKQYETQASQKKQQYKIDSENYTKTENYKLHQSNLKKWKEKCSELKKQGSGKKTSAKKSSNSKNNDKDDDESEESGSGNSDNDENEQNNNSDESDENSDESEDNQNNNKSKNDSNNNKQSDKKNSNKSQDDDSEEESSE